LPHCGIGGYNFLIFHGAAELSTPAQFNSILV
jgi:hypothetical protein